MVRNLIQSKQQKYYIVFKWAVEGQMNILLTYNSYMGQIL